MRIFIACGAVVLSLSTIAAADMYSIKNPAEKISNPADTMYNPASKVENPAGNIYNPATRMKEPDPLSPPTQAQPVPRPVAAEVVPPARPATKETQPTRPKPAIPQKDYNYKTARAYINAAKKAFSRDNFVEFVAIAEDAVRRMNSGALKASKKNRQQLVNYAVFGYGLLEKSAE